MKMRNLWLALTALTALTALVGFQVPRAYAVPQVDFWFTVDCPTCLYSGGPPGLLITEPHGPGKYLVTSMVGMIGPFTASVATVGTVPGAPGYFNDNILYYPPIPAMSFFDVFFDLGGLGINVGPNPTDVLCSTSVGCAVGYPDPSAIDGYYHPATISISETPLPAALPLFAGGLGALGLFGWRRKRKNAAALTAA
jgi:hypothetical protein